MINDLELDFLRRLRDSQPLASPDRKEDRARQRCRKMGLAEVVMNPPRWIITDRGRNVLEEHPQ
ncbi:hypothetical protein [Pararhizobium mangrovi]|uniref:Uncharacterized protein n=1 Tax=Pararhizobium mangrovi TaxID=2590452 RepID=A0A506TXQ4_9HYPH|nr:hypothetical protein [Pararhizobium mangrovi]TPW26842.1 hypothetical protein FJU11_13635 [Pararhizobium mangrovi]